MNSMSKLKVIINHHDYFNYTFCLNKYNFLNGIILTEAIEDLQNIRILIQSSLSLFEDYEIYIDELKKDSTIKLDRFDFTFNLNFLRNLTEKDIDTIKVAVISDDVALCTQQFSIDVLPMDYFGGLQSFPQLLASYVLSNHSDIYKIKTEVVKILENNDLNVSFEGYQSKNKERVLQIVSSIYKAIQIQQLVYSAMPASFEKTGQRIRLVDKVLETKFGNCIDISLLFAACLEAVNLNPILVITQGHAFVGVWLDDLRFDAMINLDQAAISKRIATGIKEIALIETTSICKGNQISFTQAMNQAETELMAESNFLMSIDIKNVRMNGISPLPLVDLEVSQLKNTIDLAVETDVDLDDEYNIGETYNDLELTDLSNLTKQKIWERKLLDLSLRNNLLNLRFTKSMLQLVDLKVNLLEDNLADGKNYTIHPDNNQSVLRKYNLYNSPLHSSLPLFKLAEDEFNYNKLLTYYHNDDLDSILTNLYRSSKLAEEENGKSTLYLGVGLLKWFEPKKKDTPRFAPILLIPVELSRKSVNSKYTLRSREEDTMINITLLEYLKQEFGLNLNALENLPMDELGVDVSKVLAILRNAILNLEGWDILEQIVLGIFSFNKLILWQDISKYSEEIQKSPIVKSLIDGQLSTTLESVEANDIELEKLPSSALILPISTDNSQLNAVKNANLNKTFILHGPPGTGKSQTITNIIADALANDKKVLFVAAKKAALDVVHHRLESIGLGPFCLELHSNKSKKSDVLQQFEKALEVPKYQLNKDFTDEANRLDSRKKELYKYTQLLHQKNKIDWSLYETISFLENNKVKFDDQLKVAIDFNHLNQNEWNNWKDWIIPFSTIMVKVKNPKLHALHLVKINTHQFDHKNNLTTAIQNYQNQWESTHAFFDQYLINDEYKGVLNFIQNNSIKLYLFEFYFNENQYSLLGNWIQLSSKKQSVENQVLTNFNRTIFSIDINSINQAWNQSKHTWFLPKWLKQRKIKKDLQGYSNAKIDDEKIDQLFGHINEFSELSISLKDSKYNSFSRLHEVYSESDKLNVVQLENDVQNLDKLNQLLVKSLTNNPQQWIENNFVKNNIQNDVIEIVQSTEKFSQSKSELEQYLTAIPDIADLDKIVNHLNQLEDWINYNLYKGKAKELQLDWFIKLIENRNINYDNVEFEFNKILRFNHFIQTIYSEDVLNGFDANIYESLIKQYKELHKEFVEISKNQLIVKLSSKIPNFNQDAAQSSEISFLQKAIRSKGRGLSIRKLFDQIPSLIPKLKPCMLMSPISIAQYFDVNQDHFDLVIFDEASQLPTSEAISALARAKQAIIVGDPKQMPPTSFFSSSRVDEDNMEMEDLESILEDCLALSIPSNYLLRHYRSKHESLISFSNKHFYDNKLLTFPSPDDLNQKVSFEFVEGFYDKGKTRTNKNEALAVVNYIKNHLEKKIKKSIGVVTFSQTQQNLIEDLLQKLYQYNPALEEFSINTEEQIFIKNLENVQGDERDIILFSIGYGPDEEGKLSMNFGPLNRDGGWRRLNVAVTRARYEMKVFSSLKGDQIDLNRTKSEGVKGLKDFLNFAEKGHLVLNNATNNIVDISLIDAISEELELNGFKVEKYIGTSDYRIDIGIVNNENEKEYILGILVDGDNYFRIHTTNDRELLAPNVLKGLGWNIYRIWTLDWLKNKERIIDEIKNRIEEIRNEIPTVEEEQVEVSQLDLEKSTLVEVESSEKIDLVKPYIAAQIISPVSANSESIYYPENRVVLVNQMREIISIEAPISKNYLFRKILKLWNISRAGAKLNTYLTSIIDSIPAITKLTSHQDFYWTEDLNSITLNYYRDNSIEKRTIDDISPEEMSVAILDIMQANLSLDKADLIRLTSKSFGFMKVGTQIDLIINQVISILIKQNKLQESDNRILLVN